MSLHQDEAGGGGRLLVILLVHVRQPNCFPSERVYFRHSVEGGLGLRLPAFLARPDKRQTLLPGAQEKGLVPGTATLTAVRAALGPDSTI